MTTKKPFICIKNFSTRMEAELAQNFLEGNEIKSIVLADDAGGMRPFPMQYAAGARLCVDEDHAEAAKKLLEESDS